MDNAYYLCIDIKSFFASVECVERGLDPMTARLVVADPERSDKTICLAVSPAMKKLGVKNRCRVFEIPENIDYIMAPPRMQKYIDYACEIFKIYLSFVSADDIHVYSIDEAFLDITKYLKLYGSSPKEMAQKIMDAIFERVGVRATCGVGTNLYLAKMALDITAKHAPDFIGILNEDTYKEQLWDYRPLTDFWRIGAGTAKKLAGYGIYTMRQVAFADEDLLYKLFGVDAELLIDHAWGVEPTTIADIKAYTSKSNCISNGQVLSSDYSAEDARLILREMLDSMCLRLLSNGYVTKSVTITIVYSGLYHCDPAKGTAKMDKETSQDRLIIPRTLELFDSVVDFNKKIRRIYVDFNDVVPEGNPEPLTLFEREDEIVEKNKKVQSAVIKIKQKFGSNAVLKGLSLDEKATARERNNEIGGHKK